MENQVPREAEGQEFMWALGFLCSTSVPPGMGEFPAHPSKPLLPAWACAVGAQCTVRILGIDACSVN